ncbi:MAG: cold-shock protein [Chloroflexi bacterium]|nr:cold-shock protein [Chloroflexota bacterium]MCL5952571.1 cold-shock protein [Chloroflexota bacterium]
MADRQTGTVKWFNAAKGYGFISHEGSKDLFVHFSEIQDAGSGYRELKEGDAVEFTVGTSPKGPQATNVVKL